MVEVLLNSSMTELVISSEFARRNRFKKKKLERLIYIINVDNTFNYKGLIEYTIEVELFFKKHKERMLIDMIGEQKWGVILGMSWLAHYNPEIDQRTEEVKMTRYPDEYGKKQRMRQMKPGWQKQKETEREEERV